MTGEARRNGMSVRILYRPGCPCIASAKANVDAALALLGKPSTPVELLAVESEQDAQREAMQGSPTVLVDGKDPFVPHDATATRLACRPDGAPTLRQLLEALS
jgi:hypothetical protein